MSATATLPYPTTTRTVAVALATYLAADGEYRTALFEEEVEVADSYLPRFDKLNRAVSIEIDEDAFTGGIVDVRKPVTPKRPNAKTR